MEDLRTRLLALCDEWEENRDNPDGRWFPTWDAAARLRAELSKPAGPACHECGGTGIDPYLEIKARTEPEPSAEAGHAMERAYSMLEIEGVPRERARSIANGITVLATRYRREIEVLERALADSQDLLDSMTTRDVREDHVVLVCPTALWERWQMRTGVAALAHPEQGETPAKPEPGALRERVMAFLCERYGSMEADMEDADHILALLPSPSALREEALADALSDLMDEVADMPADPAECYGSWEKCRAALNPDGRTP